MAFVRFLADPTNILENFMHTIRFFIDMNGKDIKNIDDLRDNFNATEALKFYKSGVLRRWILSHYGHEEAKKLDAISEESNTSILHGLWTLFNPTGDIREIDNAVHYIQFVEQENANLEKIGKTNKDKAAVINKYHTEYEEIKTSLLDRVDDMRFCREAIKLLGKNYLQLFILDYDAFTKKLFDEAPSNLLLLFSNQEIRGRLVASGNLEILAESVYKILKSKLSGYIPVPYGTYGKNDTETEEKNITTLFRVSNKYTHETWEDIEPDKEKQFMILRIPDGCFVREASTRREVTSKELLTFPIVNGVDYKSKDTSDNALVYMEV